MRYQFKSPATADLLMLGTHGDQFLRLIGKAPAPQGILQAAELPAAVEALRAAIVQDEAQRSSHDSPPGHARVGGAQAASPLAEDPDVDAISTDTVSLRQRMAPLIAMMTAAHAADKDIVWGV